MTQKVEHEVQAVLDVRGLKCPLPALYARRRLIGAPPGTRLVVVADDPMAAVDIPHMCHQDGFAVERSERDGDQVTLTLRKP